MEVNKLKTYTLEELKKEFIGEIGTKKRNKYEEKLRKAVSKRKSVVVKK